MLSQIHLPANKEGAANPPADDRELTVLYQLSALATRADDPHVALTEMLKLFIATFKADAGSIALLCPDNNRLETEVQMGPTTEGPAAYGLKSGHGVTGWCALNRRSLLVPDVLTEPRYIAVRSAARSEMAVPILDGENVVGVIDLESDHRHGFLAADIGLLERFSAEVGHVLRRLWQVGHLGNKARQLESLIVAGQSLVTKLDQQELLEMLSREARNMMQARECALYLFDAESRTVRCAAITTSGVLTPTRGAIPLQSSLVAAPIRIRQQVSFADIQSPEFHELLDRPADPTLRSVLITPMLIEGQALGAVAIFTDRVHRFDNDEKRLCAALASLGAVALQNARLYARVFQSEEVLRKNERLTTLGLLAAEIAHEIRNPLTVLKLLHDGLGVDFSEEDPRRTDMRVIGEKLDQLEGIVTRVLNFGKAPTSLHSRWSLSDIIQDTLILVRLKLAQSKVSLRCDPLPRPLFIEAHKAQIQQALLNLLLNATQAMVAGGTITVIITTWERANAPHVCIDICDTGSGIPEQIRDRIFDSFLSGRPEGTGLGLAIVKRILSSHHGDVTLHSTSAQGTTMRITLPLAR
ncbi:MAG: hypothetical protein RL077_2963 [Verrucomicrobiota bacterium]